MKKILLLLLVTTLVFALLACGKDKDNVVKDDTNKTTEQKEKDEVVDNEAGATDENDDDSQTENSNKLENNSSNEQSSTDQTTDVNNTTTNDSSNKNNNQSNGNGTTTKPNTNTQTNTHKHSYSAATCTQPKKCSCGTTEGKALGHTYANATCTKPKTCTCGATSGKALGHNYDEDGVCSRCLTKDPNFKYPTLASMGGRWSCIFEVGNFYEPNVTMVELMTFYFDTNASFDIIGTSGMANKKCECCEYDRGCITWKGVHQYFTGGYFPSEQFVFSEKGSNITITDNSNNKIEFQRTSTKTMKVISIDPNFAWHKISMTQISIGAVFSFENVNN